MKDKNYLYSIIEREKDISNCYSLFLNDASNDYLYENIFSMLEDSKDMAREIYNLLYSKDRLDLEEVDSMQLDILINKLKKEVEN